MSHEIIFRVRPASNPPTKDSSVDGTILGYADTTDCHWITSAEWLAWFDGGAMPVALALTSQATQDRWLDLKRRLDLGRELDVRPNIVAHGGCHTVWGWKDLKVHGVADVIGFAEPELVTIMEKEKALRDTLEYRKELPATEVTKLETEGQIVLPVSKSKTAAPLTKAAMLKAGKVPIALPGGGGR